MRIFKNKFYIQIAYGVATQMSLKECPISNFYTLASPAPIPHRHQEKTSRENFLIGTRIAEDPKP